VAPATLKTGRQGPYPFPAPLIDIELFAGAGGLAIGLAAAGFPPSQLYEIDPHSCSTLDKNRQLGGLSGSIHERDVSTVDWCPFAGRVRLVAAGVPCQPFSHGGKRNGHRDDRDLFPELIRAVRVTRPEAVIVENVAGLLRTHLKPYFEYILQHLECPSMVEGRDSKWRNILAKLRKHRYSIGFEPEYVVQWRLVDAADYGVPQNRRRVVIVATRSDRPVYAFPTKTHSKQSLLRAQAMGTYWAERGLKRPRASVVGIPDDDGLRPWRTVRDALSGLPSPGRGIICDIPNHQFIPGARAYDGHSGSRLDWPSKAIKAGVHGVPGGENTLIDERKRFRYYTFREAARVQTFPDSHVFVGTRLRITRQIGNAVPCELARVLASPLLSSVSGNHLPVGVRAHASNASGS
jgi:DNA (cytosine-5)-methyltransferase 1